MSCSVSSLTICSWNGVHFLVRFPFRDQLPLFPLDSDIDQGPVTMATLKNIMASTSLQEDKFQQPGWRIEQRYRPGVLIGEWMQAVLYSKFKGRLFPMNL